MQRVQRIKIVYGKAVADSLLPIHVKCPEDAPGVGDTSCCKEADWRITSAATDGSDGQSKAEVDMDRV